ncbi:MAG: MarR family transcriptional regulator [Fimbriimonas sp.]|nr:MarR family transcriptional regulator [Fimbriimonas sp.]
MGTHFEGPEVQRIALDLFIKLARASESFSGRVDVPILEAGLTPTQFGVLETLMHLGPLSPSQLAAKHLKSRNNLSVVIENLDRDGLIERVRCPKDRRVQYIHLTQKGRARIEELFPRFARIVAQEATVLTAEEQRELCRLLKILGTGVAQQTQIGATGPGQEPNSPDD